VSRQIAPHFTRRSSSCPVVLSPTSVVSTPRSACFDERRELLPRGLNLAVITPNSPISSTTNRSMGLADLVPRLDRRGQRAGWGSDRYSLAPGNSSSRRRYGLLIVRMRSRPSSSCRSTVTPNTARSSSTTTRARPGSAVRCGSCWRGDQASRVPGHLQHPGSKAMEAEGPLLHRVTGTLGASSCALMCRVAGGNRTPRLPQIPLCRDSHNGNYGGLSHCRLVPMPRRRACRAGPR